MTQMMTKRAFAGAAAAAAALAAQGVLLGGWLGCSSSSSNGFADAGGKDSGGDSSVSYDVSLPAVSCDAYCPGVIAACTGTNAQYTGATPQQTLDDCTHLCAAMTPGMYGDTTDSIGCRQYHVDSITQRGGSPTAFCPQAGPFGGAVCGDRCTAFCKYAQALCNTQNGNPQPWASSADCLANCAMNPWDPDAGEFDPNDTNHLNCFEYHLRAAYVEPDADLDESGQTTAQEHCSDLITDPDAAPGGTPTCVL